MDGVDNNDSLHLRDCEKVVTHASLLVSPKTFETCKIIKETKAHYVYKTIIDKC